jgi:hypothetical protein
VKARARALAPWLAVATALALIVTTAWWIDHLTTR